MKGKEQFRRWKACERKQKYPSAEAAFQKGQESYQCRYCGLWHRTGGLGKLVAALRKRRAR